MKLVAYIDKSLRLHYKIRLVFGNNYCLFEELYGIPCVDKMQRFVMLNQVNVNSRKLLMPAHEGEFKNLTERSRLQNVSHFHLVFFWGFSRRDHLFTVFLRLPGEP